MVGGGQRLTAKATQPLSVIVWWRPDSDGGLLVLELQPRTGSIIFARDGVYLFVLFCFVCLFVCFFVCFNSTIVHSVFWFLFFILFYLYSP